MTKRLPVKAHITGNVWKITVQVGSVVSEGDTVVIMESMKMETAILAGAAGKVSELLVAPGTAVKRGTLLARIES